MYFTGAAGSGHAVFVMKDSVIVGADAIGGVLDGTYKEIGDGNLDVTITLEIPAGGFACDRRYRRKEALRTTNHHDTTLQSRQWQNDWCRDANWASQRCV